MLNKILKTIWKYLVLIYRATGLFFIVFFTYKGIQCFNESDLNNVFLNFLGVYAGLTMLTLGDEW